ncbi:hypothetical protein PHYSODRAFT_417339, partial [Phytophthora sojae]
VATAFSAVHLSLSNRDFPTAEWAGGRQQFQLHKLLQSAVPEYVRRTQCSLPTLIELLRGQTTSDYRPNKDIVPAVIQQSCRTYPKLHTLLPIVQEGITVTLTSPMPRQTSPPRNHPSATKRLNVLRKNIRKEQDLGRCIVVDRAVAQFWPELFLSPFGVIDKGNGDPDVAGRVIHDLSFPEGASVNDHTDAESVPTAEYKHCAAIAREILAQKERCPGRSIKILLGD